MNRLRQQAVERASAGFVSLKNKKTSATVGGICFSWVINERTACFQKKNTTRTHFGHKPMINFQTMNRT